MMKPGRHIGDLIRVFCLLAVLLAAAPARAEPFVDGFEDLPLAPSLTGIPEAKVAFDTTEGRIVVSFARTERDEATVLAFYRAALPQLGWTASSSHGFEREGEALEIDFSNDGEGLIVRFSLSPKK